MTEHGISSAGFIKKTYPEILEDYRTTAKTVYGQDVDLSEYTPQGQLIQIFAYQNAVIWDLLEHLYYSAYVATATDTSLDHLVAILGLPRKAALKARGHVTFFGQPNLSIPKGTIISDPDGYHKYLTDISATIPVSQEITIPITALEYGYDHNIEPNTLTKTIPTLGNYVIYNRDPITGGRDRETDIQLRDRAISGSSSTGYATANNITTYIRSKDTVEYADIEENEPDNSFTIYYSGTCDPATMTAYLNDRRSVGISYTINKLQDVFISIYAELDPIDPLKELQMINDAHLIFNKYVTSIPRNRDFTWTGTYQQLIRSLDNLNDLPGLTLTSSEHADPITQIGTSFTKQDGTKFLPDTSVFWIKNKTYTVTTDIIGVTNTDIIDDLTNLYTNHVMKHPIGTPLDWDELYTALTQLPNPPEIYHLTAHTPISTSNHPGSAVSSPSNFKFLPGPLTLTPADPIPITGTIKILLNDNLAIPDLSAAGDLLKTLIWKKGIGQPITSQDLTQISPQILSLHKDINSIIDIQISDTSNIASLKSGTIPCPPTSVTTMPEPPIVAPGYASLLTITAALNRSDPAIPLQTLKTAATTRITDHFKETSIGDPIRWNDINNIILGIPDISRTLNLSISSNKNAYAIAAPNTQIDIPASDYGIPTTLNISIYDTLTVTITITATKTHDILTPDQAATYINSQISGHLMALNDNPDRTITWSGLYSAILYSNEYISDITELTIATDRSTDTLLTQHGDTLPLQTTDYITTGTHAITLV